MKELPDKIKISISMDNKIKLGCWKPDNYDLSDEEILLIKLRLEKIRLRNTTYIKVGEVGEINNERPTGFSYLLINLTYQKE